MGAACGVQQLGRLLVTGIALSFDNLAVGFALGTYHVSLPAAAAVIGTVSVVMSLAGLELGARIGMRAGSAASWPAAWSSSAWVSPSAPVSFSPSPAPPWQAAAAPDAAGLPGWRFQDAGGSRWVSC